MPEQSSFVVDNFASFKIKALRWAQQFEYNLCLDNHFQASPYQETEFLLAVDAIQLLKLKDEDNQFDLFDAFQRKAKSSVFGYFSYDLKNELERLDSTNPDRLNLASCFFFEPRYIISFIEGKCTINRSTLEALHILDQIKEFDDSPSKHPKLEIDWKSRVDQTSYIENVKKIKQDIEEGTVYELNYCREIYAENVELSPLDSFLQINEQAKAPFSAFLKMGTQYALSFSPERFVQLK